MYLIKLYFAEKGTKAECLVLLQPKGRLTTKSLHLEKCFRGNSGCHKHKSEATPFLESPPVRRAKMS